MSAPAADYAKVQAAIQDLIGQASDRGACARHVVRSAAVYLRWSEGPQSAAELAYKLADEFAGEGVGS